MLKCIRLIEPRVDENIILHSLLESMGRKELSLFHFDVTTSVRLFYVIYIFFILSIIHLEISISVVSILRKNVKPL